LVANFILSVFFLCQSLVGKEGLIRGFLVSTYNSRWPDGIIQMAEWLKEGKVKNRETVYHGFEKVPEAFIALFEGTNVGKVVVQL